MFHCFLLAKCFFMHYNISMEEKDKYKKEKENIKYKLIWSDSDCEEDPSDYEELGPDPETDYPDMPEWVYDRFTKTE